MLQKIEQHFVFKRFQRDLFSVFAYAVRMCIKKQTVHDLYFSAACRFRRFFHDRLCTFVSVQNSPDLCKENIHLERLFDIIISANIKCHKQIVITCTGTDEKDRHIVFAPYALTQLKSRLVPEVNI